MTRKQLIKYLNSLLKKEDYFYISIFNINMKRLKEFICEGKISSESLAKDYFLMTIEDNDKETIEDDIEIFLDTIEEELYNKDIKAFNRFRSAIINHVKNY